MVQPLAIGLIKVGNYADPVERRRSHVSIGAFAHVEGYALVETFEIVGEAVRDAATILALRHLAVRAEADALLIAEDVPSSVLHRVVQGITLTSVVVG
jgi:hypothetical protein